MTIQSPDDLGRSIEAAVRGGNFATVDDAMAEAARLLLRELGRGRSDGQPPVAADDPGPGLIGALRDDAEWLDRAVEHAMNVRSGRRSVDP